MATYVLSGRAMSCRFASSNGPVPDALSLAAIRKVMRPSNICRQLLAALEPSEGRRRQRKRDTTPDAFGMTLKRELLERAVQEDPEPDAFERWLLEYCLAAGSANGPLRAMAQD